MLHSTQRGTFKSRSERPFESRDSKSGEWKDRNTHTRKQHTEDGGQHASGMCSLQQTGASILQTIYEGRVMGLMQTPGCSDVCMLCSVCVRSRRRGMHNIWVVVWVLMGLGEHHRGILIRSLSACYLLGSHSVDTEFGANSWIHTSNH